MTEPNAFVYNYKNEKQEVAREQIINQFTGQPDSIDRSITEPMPYGIAWLFYTQTMGELQESQAPEKPVLMRRGKLHRVKMWAHALTVAAPFMLLIDALFVAALVDSVRHGQHDIFAWLLTGGVTLVTLACIVGAVRCYRREKARDMIFYDGFVP